AAPPVAPRLLRSRPGQPCRRLPRGADPLGLCAHPPRPPRQRDEAGARAMDAGAPRVLPADGHRVASTRRADSPDTSIDPPPPSLTSPPTLLSPPRSRCTASPNAWARSSRLRAVLWARLTIRGRTPKQAADRNGECES